jgi:hypothetical protein
MLKMLAGPLLVMVMAAGAVAQNAAARKQFAKTVLESVKDPPPGLKVTAEGPDDNMYVLHLPGMTYAMCQSVFSREGVVEELKKVGFAHYVCTDDGKTTFTFDLTYDQPAPTPGQSQPVAKPESGAADTPGAAARKQFIERVNQAFAKDQGSKLPPKYEDTVEGPDATIYVSHNPGVTYSICKNMLQEDYVSDLVSLGFKQLVCTGGGDTRFAFDLIAQQQSQSSGSASGPLLVKPEQPRPQPFGFHARMTQQEAIAAVGKAAVKAGDPERKPYGSVLSLSTAPKPNASFDKYILKFSVDGLFELRAYTTIIESADDGTQVRDEFDELRNLITMKYGYPSHCPDFRDSGTSERPDFFMMYLKDKEQHLECYWHVGRDAIALDAVGLTVKAAVLCLEYQFSPEFDRAKSGADEKKEDTF